MVCYAVASGAPAAQITARGKHYVLFDLPADKGQEFKKAQPFLGWVADIDGHPALPFSVAARLILQVYNDEASATGLFAEFPAAQLFARVWSTIVTP